MSTMPYHRPEALAARALARAAAPASIEALRTSTHALYWNGKLLRPHASEAAAEADRADCLARRVADVQKALPAGTFCALCASKDHGHEKHHADHVGAFEVRPYTTPPAASR